MKRLPLFFAFALPLLAAGCRTRTGEDFEPTRPGYYLYEQYAEPLLRALDDAWPVFAFARYYEAADDAEQEAFHNLFFYTQRIVCDDGGCRIICDRYELAIHTGGRPLSDPDACWTYRYEGRAYPDGVPTLRGAGADAGIDTADNTAAAPSCYTLCLPASQELRTLSGEWRVESRFESSVPAPGTTVQSLVLSLSGEGAIRTYDVVVGGQTLEPLVYRSTSQLFERGALRLQASAADAPSVSSSDASSSPGAAYASSVPFASSSAPDTAEAFIEGPGQVRIVYNGYQKTWSTYGDYFFYE